MQSQIKGSISVITLRNSIKIFIKKIWFITNKVITFAVPKIRERSGFKLQKINLKIFEKRFGS